MSERVSESKSIIINIVSKLGIISLIYIICFITANVVFASDEIRVLNIPLLWIKTVTQDAYSGEFIDVTFRLDNNTISNISGVGIIAEYDPSILSVVDASGKPSSLIIPGSCPVPDYVIENTADAGIVSYGVAQSPSSATCFGGELAKVYFRCADSITTLSESWIKITESILVDPDAIPIQHTTQNAEFICHPRKYTYLPAVYR